MSCRICGRGDCSEAFHSVAAIERQDKIDAGECEQCLDYGEELESLRDELAKYQAVVTAGITQERMHRSPSSRRVVKGVCQCVVCKEVRQLKEG